MKEITIVERHLIEMTKPLTIEMRQGAMAYFKGLDFNDNPHETESEYKDWAEGFRKAKDLGKPQASNSYPNQLLIADNIHTVYRVAIKDKPKEQLILIFRTIHEAMEQWLKTPGNLPQTLSSKLIEHLAAGKTLEEALNLVDQEARAY